jgi:hypothetical protein
MPNMNISFGGNVISIPGVYYKDNVTQTSPGPAQQTLPLVFLGYSYNGASGQVYNFSSANDLTDFVRGGPCASYIEPLTNPSPNLAGSNNILFVPVGANTPSSITLNNSATSGTIALTSATSGIPSNLMQVEVVSGSMYPASSSSITLFDGYSNTTQTGNNLGVPFQLAYTGTATSGLSYSVSGTLGNAVSLTVTSPNAGESATIQLGSGLYDTTALVVEYLNGTGFWTASLISDTGGQLPASWLSPVSGALTTPTSGNIYNYAGVLAIPYDAVFWVNQFASVLASAAVAGTPSSSTPLANIPLTHFTGAASVPPTNSSYASGFNLALNYPGWVVFADSNALAVQLLGAQHVEAASEPVAGKNRRFFTGSSVGDSVATTLSNIAAMNCIEACYAYPGVQVVNTSTGQLQTLGGLYAAAQAAGIASANQVALPLTNKSLNAAGVEFNLTASQINQLQIGGALPIVLGGANGTTPTILSDQTTWQVDDNPLNVFTQQVACRWWLAYTMRKALQQYIGGIASPDTLTQIANAAKAALNASIYTPGSNGVLASWDAGSLLVTYTGATQTAAVSAIATTVGQYRFITETISIQLYSGSATAQ